MKSIKRSVLCALLFSMAACGGDSERGVDPMSFMPKLPAVEQPAPNVAQSEPAVTPAKPTVEPGVEHQGPRRAQPVRVRRRDRGILEGSRAQPGQRVGVEQPRLHGAPAQEV